MAKFTQKPISLDARFCALPTWSLLTVHSKVAQQQTKEDGRPMPQSPWLVEVVRGHKSGKQ
jgi:hypothetical protein